MLPVDHRVTTRPADPGIVATEVRRLHSTGLKPRDISEALRLPLSTVLEMLRQAA